MSTRGFERVRQIALTAVLVVCAAALQGCPRRNCPACQEPPPPPPAASCGSDPADIAKVFPNNSQGAAKHPNILLLSGGGSWGAYGAGILKGWKQNGSRPPQFDIVTGTSTGALIATYAFLGSNFDDKLKDVFTDVEDSDIYTKRFLLVVPFSNSLNTLALRNPIKVLSPTRLLPFLLRNCLSFSREGVCLTILGTLRSPRSLEMARRNGCGCPSPMPYQARYAGLHHLFGNL